MGDEINDFLSSAGDLISETYTWLRKKVYYSNPDQYPKINRDLVGEPLTENVWGGEYEKKIVPTSEENKRAIEDAITENNGGEIVITEGTVGNIEIPETVTAKTTITAPMEHDTTVTSNSTKTLYLNNTSEEPINLNLDAAGVSTVYLTGQFETITSNTNIKVTEGSVEDVVIDNEVGKNITVVVPFAEDGSVTSNTNRNITITNSTEEGSNLNVNTPNSSVTMRGEYGTVTSNVSDATLTVAYNTNIKKLVVQKGNVIVNDTAVENRIAEVVNNTEYTVTVPVVETNDWTTFKNAAYKNGIIEVTGDITKSGAGVVFGITAAGNIKWKLNGHTLTCGNSSSGSVLQKGANSNLTVENGSIINNTNNYGLWLSGGGTLNLHDVNVTASTHAVYCEKGIINIYGGEYRLTGENKTFLVNCYDTNYTDGTAKINIYGGTFYGWNPAASMGEPNGPVSFVAEGYEVQEIEESVYKVVKS